MFCTGSEIVLCFYGNIKKTSNSESNKIPYKEVMGQEKRKREKKDVR